MLSYRLFSVLRNCIFKGLDMSQVIQRLFYGLPIIGFVLFFNIYFPGLNSPFYIPKMMIFLSFACLGSLLLWFSPQIRFPHWRIGVWFLLGLGLMGLSLIVSSNLYDSYTHITTYVAAFVLFIFALNIPLKGCYKDIPLFTTLIFAVGVFQSIVANVQFISANLLSSPDGFVRSVGLIGNPEFLSALLGISFFMGLSLRPLNSITLSPKEFILERSSETWKSLAIWAGLLSLFLGILSTGNKGTVLFIFGYAFYRLIQDKRWVQVSLVFGLFMMGLVVVWQPILLSLQSRMFLWLVNGWMMLNHPLFGVGIGQFGHAYTDMIYDIFQRFPFLSMIFGSLSSAVGDGHQILLHYGSELGFLGIFWALSFILFSLKRVLEDNFYIGLSLFFLIFKSFYTVVLGSVTGIVLWVLLLAYLLDDDDTRTVVLTQYSRLVTIVAVIFTCGAALGLHRADYYYYKGRQALVQSRLEVASSHFEKATHYHPGHSSSYLSLAYIAYLNQDLPKMEDHIQSAHYLYHDINAIKLEADMRFYLRQYDRAEPLYNYLHTVFPDQLGPSIKLALIEMYKGNPTKASHRAKQVLDHTPRIDNPVHQTYKDIAKELLLD